MRKQKRGIILANDGWRSSIMDYDAAWNFAKTLHRLGNYGVMVVKVK